MSFFGFDADPAADFAWLELVRGLTVAAGVAAGRRTMPGRMRDHSFRATFLK